MVTKVGYSPLFVALAAFDIVAAIIIWFVTKPLATPVSTQSSGDASAESGDVVPTA
jgi:ACS family hexuronate transporter-like MFS transporter